jgi:hypothetical protein
MAVIHQVCNADHLGASSDGVTSPVAQMARNGFHESGREVGDVGKEAVTQRMEAEQIAPGTSRV